VSLTAQDTYDAARPDDAQLVRHRPGDDFAHIYARNPSGTVEPLVDVHLPCGRANSFTVTLPDGTTDHVCRACLLDRVTGAEEPTP
jgi:hypothetical protein